VRSRNSVPGGIIAPPTHVADATAASATREAGGSR
jgi:hypothetical protein